METSGNSAQTRILLCLDNKAVKAYKSKLSIAFPKFFDHHREGNSYHMLNIKDPEKSKAVRKLLETFINYSENGNLDEVFKHSVFDVYLAVKWRPLDNQKIYDETIRRLVRNFQENENVAETLKFAEKHDIKSVLRAYDKFIG